MLEREERYPWVLSKLLGAGMLFITLLLFATFVGDGYQLQGGTRRYLDGMMQIPNWLGWPGAVLAGIFSILFGDASHVLYALTFLWSLMLFWGRPFNRIIRRLLGLFAVLCAMAGLLHIDTAGGASNALAGGEFGAFVADSLLLPYIGVIGANVFCLTLLMVGVLMSTDFLFISAFVGLERLLVQVLRGNLVFAHGFFHLWRRGRAGAAILRREQAWVREQWQRDAADMENAPAASLRKHRLRRKITAPEDSAEGAAEACERIRINTPGCDAPDAEAPFDAVPEIEEETGAAVAAKPVAVTEDLDPAPRADAEQLTLEEVEADRKGAVATLQAKPKKKRRPRRKTADLEEELPPDYKYPKRYTKPSMEILDEPECHVIANLQELLRGTSIRLEETLQTFSIEAQVTDVTRGPTITRFELEPAPGIKVSRFLALADDIALALKAHRVRIEAPIPGKGRVGIEVPNDERDPVLIRELLESRFFARGKGKLNLALGKDIAGEVKIADLASMPHLLVAGATGAGKTVCVKSLLASLLFQHTPDELQLILIDPKMVELSIFNNIPHLITPVVTDPKKASLSLAWLINEMEERYRLFADLRVRNIEVYNKSVENGEIEMEPEDDEDEQQALSLVRKLPYIVCVIDELADLMMLARSEVEDAIARLAQLARAVGIHLIIATQRPSVDVLTGVIKANFPARISFQVSSRVDSRCILDEIGAERLIGMGDMLYLPAGRSKPTRIQGAFVSDSEMNLLINYLKTQAPPQYRDEIENYGKSSDGFSESDDELDPLFDEAVTVVLDTGQASISMVQRRLRVGYTRAARLIDMMERKGIVGPHTGSKAREILVDAAQQDDVA